MAASLWHETLVELLQRNPRLAPWLAAARGLPVPPHDEVRTHPEELTELVPVGFRAGAVALLAKGTRVVHAFVNEVQLRPDDDKRYRWPFYQAVSRARHRCPTTLCVLAFDPDVARWCAQPIVSGQPGSPFVPLTRARGLALGDPSPRGIGIRTKTRVRLNLGVGARRLFRCCWKTPPSAERAG